LLLQYCVTCPPFCCRFLRRYRSPHSPPHRRFLLTATVSTLFFVVAFAFAFASASLTLHHNVDFAFAFVDILTLHFIVAIAFAFAFAAILAVAATDFVPDFFVRNFAFMEMTTLAASLLPITPPTPQSFLFSPSLLSLLSSLPLLLPHILSCNC
jgi:hypothetical protein